MNPRTAAAGSALFFLAAPAVVVGLVPWLLTGWQSGAATTSALQVVGWVVLALAIVLLVLCFSRFVSEGRGTPAPVAPTEHLVVGGIYRFVRNPMYLAVVSGVVGEALILGRVSLWWYAIVIAVAMVSFVKLYEEPALSARFGAEYNAYRRNVPGWLPRRTPWQP